MPTDVRAAPSWPCMTVPWSRHPSRLTAMPKATAPTLSGVPRPKPTGTWSSVYRMPAWAEFMAARSGVAKPVAPCGPPGLEGQLVLQDPPGLADPAGLGTPPDTPSCRPVMSSGPRRVARPAWLRSSRPRSCICAASPGQDVRLFSRLLFPQLSGIRSLPACIATQGAEPRSLDPMPHRFRRPWEGLPARRAIRDLANRMPTFHSSNAFLTASQAKAR